MPRHKTVPPTGLVFHNNQQFIMSSSYSPLRNFLFNLVPCLIISAAVTVVILYFTGNLGGLGDDIDGGLDKIFTVDSDPFQGFTIDQASRWDTTSYTEGGLQIELWNACEDRWTSFFDRAVSEWDAGSPDVLTLTASRVDVDGDCMAVDGIIKVCNGDYGDTQWRGINEILIQDDYIISSTAKMNDFYLDKESDQHKQMTMCHEASISICLASHDCNRLTITLFLIVIRRLDMALACHIVTKIPTTSTWATAWTIQSVPSQTKVPMKHSSPFWQSCMV
jgi:hypothetical protein